MNHESRMKMQTRNYRDGQQDDANLDAHQSLRNGELTIDVLGVNAFDPFFGNSHAARKAMMSTHIGQAPVVDGNEPRWIFTGVEMRYAEGAFNVTMPVDAKILKVFKKYPPGVDINAIKSNPLTTIIYEDYYDYQRKTVGMLQVPQHLSLHQEFGFEYHVRKEEMSRIVPGALIEKGTILATSSAVRRNNQYGIGVQTNVAFMSKPGTIEDGLEVSESFLKKMIPTTYSTLVAGWGRKSIPLNLYGDDHHYKPFPDVGERIRDDGLVFAMRDIDMDLSPAEMTPRALREVDYAFDQLRYGKRGAKVVDIDVYYDDRQNPPQTLTGMDTQARKYYNAEYRYYKEILNYYHELRRRRQRRVTTNKRFPQEEDTNGLFLTPALNRLIVEAQIFLPVPMEERKLTKMYRLESLDEWRVELTYENKPLPGEGFKFTDFQGGF